MVRVAEVLITGFGLTVTVTVVEPEHPPTLPVKVYVVLTVGDTTYGLLPQLLHGGFHV